jgi:hypothetical protein
MVYGTEGYSSVVVDFVVEIVNKNGRQADHKDEATEL